MRKISFRQGLMVALIMLIALTFAAYTQRAWEDYWITFRSSAACSRLNAPSSTKKCSPNSNTLQATSRLLKPSPAGIVAAAVNPTSQINDGHSFLKKCRASRQLATRNTSDKTIHDTTAVR